MLSARQAEIARLIAAGNTNREIAQKLFLSARTVESHIVALFNKFNVRSRTELASRLALSTAYADQARPVRTNIPRQLTDLIAREAEVAELGMALEATRLVTVIGAGGVGKTRLAVALAADFAGTREDGIFLVDLSTCKEPTSIIRATADAIGIDASKRSASIETLVTSINDQRIVLLLDGCEHVIAEVADITRSLLEACSKLRVLATSRQPLVLPHERTILLRALRVPSIENAAPLPATEAAHYGAIALFVERAQAVDHRFVLTDDNAQTIAAICSRLDGIPLAIELAATRVCSLTLEVIEQKLDRRFEFLTGGNRAVVPRHQTLRALFDWSYDLLSPAEQRFFDRLSLFRGSFTPTAAVAAFAAEGVAEHDVCELLSSLADKSLVLVDSGSREALYALSESAQQYAREKLAARALKRPAEVGHLG